MNNKNIWMVRCGRGSEYFDIFKEKNIVAIGFDANDLSEYSTPEEMWEMVKVTFPEWSLGKARQVNGQLYNFKLFINIDDYVLTYNSTTREYLLGKVTSEYIYDQSICENMPHIRKVEWIKTIPRDLLSNKSKNSLGSIMTLFKIKEEVYNELISIENNKTELQPLKSTEIDTNNLTDDEEMIDIYEDQVEKSKEFIKDKIHSLDWEQMEKLVAGILRGMGYRTRMTSKGADGGRDIIASPDGLGLEDPKIIVEVKHRQNAMGSQDIKSFLGGLRSGDKALYVSTGGFSKDAKHEAIRAIIPITLLDLDDIVELLTQHYENCDVDTKTLIPLVKILWPVD